MQIELRAVSSTLSLTEAANEIGVAKSTLSENLDSVPHTKPAKAWGGRIQIPRSVVERIKRVKRKHDFRGVSRVLDLIQP